MARNLRAALAALVIFTGTLTSASAGDDGVVPYRKHRCPHSMYNHLGYLAPWVWRLDAYCHPRPNIYPPPPCAADFLVRRYPCPAVDPAARPYYPNLGTPEPTAEVAPMAPQFGMPY